VTNALADKGRARAIIEYLSLLQEAETLDIAELGKILASLRAETWDAGMQQTLLEKLFSVFRARLKPFLRQFVGVCIPLDRSVRHQSGLLQDFLDNLARAHETLLKIVPTPYPPEIVLSFMERIAFCLCQHIQVSYWIAAPVRAGIWQRLHGVYLRSLGLPCRPPLVAYREALLLAAAQPNSCATQELAFVTEYVHKCAEKVVLTTELPQKRDAVFWIVPTHDFAPFALARRLLPPGCQTFYFSAAEAARQAENDLAALNAGAQALPEWAPAGQGALRRLAIVWGAPSKRHFPRRRQVNHQRAWLCAGLARFCQLLQKRGEARETDGSRWMILNESPEGYALMHLNGAVGQVRIGDVVALRLEASPDRMVCLVRWAISENPEHIEIGLQVVAQEAIPAVLVDNESSFVRTPLLLLPECPSLCRASALIVPAGALADKRCAIRLSGSKKIRNLSRMEVREQNSCIEMFALTE
jgi:hypothetical protein